MSTAPSVQYSITMRLEAPAKPTTVSELTSAIEASGGIVTALDVNHSDADRVRVDVTCATRNSEHAEDIVDRVKGSDHLVHHDGGERRLETETTSR